MAAIAAVFTIGHIAQMLGEDEDWLHDLSIDMFPEDGCLHVYGVGEDGVTAFRLNRCRRLAKDWENLNRKALAFLRLASIRLMLRKLCNPA